MLFVLAAWTAMAADALAEDLLEFVLLQNQANMKRISTAVYEAQYSIDFPLGMGTDQSQPEPGGRPIISSGDRTGAAHKEGRCTVKRKGQWVASEFVEELSFAGGAKQTQGLRTILNDDYVATWDPRTVSAEKCDHESIESMRPQIKAQLPTFVSINPFTALLPGMTDLHQWYVETKERIKWDVREKTLPDSGKAYEVTLRALSQASSGPPAVVLTLDPTRGFQIARKVVHFPDGSLQEESTSLFEELKGQDLWYPREIVRTVYRLGPADQTANDRKSKSVHIRITAMQVNQPIEDEVFSLATLGLTNGTALVRKTLSGDVVGLIWQDGRLVPAELFEIARREQQDLEARLPERLAATWPAAADARRNVPTTAPARPRGDTAITESAGSPGSSRRAWPFAVSLAALLVAAGIVALVVLRPHLRKR
jgi:hypothetical protein